MKPCVCWLKDSEGKTVVFDPELDLHVRDIFTDHTSRAREPDNLFHSEQTKHKCLTCKRRLICWSEWKLDPDEHQRLQNEAALEFEALPHEDPDARLP